MINSKKVLVFKTNVRQEEDLKILKPVFEQQREVLKWSVDMDDEDKVLRIETRTLPAKKIESLVLEAGFNCIELPD